MNALKKTLIYVLLKLKCIFCCCGISKIVRASTNLNIQPNS